MWLAGTSQILLLCSTQVASIHIKQTHILQLRGGGDSVVIDINDAEENDLSTATVKKSAMNEPRIVEIDPNFGVDQQSNSKPTTEVETSTDEKVATEVREASGETVITQNKIVENNSPIEEKTVKPSSTSEEAGTKAAVMKKDNESVAFIPKSPSDQNAIVEPINKKIDNGLRRRFADASLSLQKILEAQKPVALNFANEVRDRYGTTASKLGRVRSNTFQKISSMKTRDISSMKAALAHHLVVARSKMSDCSASAIHSIVAFKFREETKMLLCMYLFAAVGSSMGFISFLYFVSVGYGASIFLMSVALLIRSNMIGNISMLSNVHTGFALLWSIRLIAFLLHREFINWPEWHAKVREVNRRGSLQSKCTIWLTCSAFYSTMLYPCMKRIVTDEKTAKWTLLGKSGLLLQCIGLLVETIADYQKGEFKRIKGNRNRFCDVGLWKFFSQPNYLGEILFWLGTYLAGPFKQYSPKDWLLSLCGIIFIFSVMKSATTSIEAKHEKNYQSDESYLDLRQRRGFFGPTLPL